MNRQFLFSDIADRDAAGSSETRSGDASLDSKQSSVQTSAEASWQFDRLFVGYQLHYIPNTVINSSAAIAVLKMVLNL